MSFPTQTLNEFKFDFFECDLDSNGTHELSRIADLVTPLHMTFGCQPDREPEAVIQFLEDFHVDFLMQTELLFSIPLRLVMALRRPRIWFHGDLERQLITVDLYFRMFLQGIQFAHWRYKRVLLRMRSDKHSQEEIDAMVFFRSAVYHNKLLPLEKRVVRDILQKVTSYKVDVPEGKKLFRMGFEIPPHSVMKGFFLHVPDDNNIEFVKLSVSNHCEGWEYSNPFMIEEQSIVLPNQMIYFAINSEKKHLFAETTTDSFTKGITDATFYISVMFTKPNNHFQVYGLTGTLVEYRDHGFEVVA